ncbi:hypothetical protein MTO96_031671, partial [Rhipicephalus appendiculatus]
MLLRPRIVRPSVAAPLQLLLVAVLPAICAVHADHGHSEAWPSEEPTEK